jgi:polyisoprenoid-binding protein YceI
MASLAELLASPQVVGAWHLLPERSRIEFRNKTFWGAVPVKGSFSDFSGDGEVTSAGAVVGRVVIRAASLNTGIGKRDEHLRSADFFDVETHPEITVQVTGVQPRDVDRADLHADLSVRGVTRSIELPAGVRVLDDGTVQISARTTLHRSDFGVSGNMVGMVGAKTTVSAELVFGRAAS